MTFQTPRTSQFPDDPKDDKERLDIIFQAFQAHPNQKIPIQYLFNNILQWPIKGDELSRLENEIILTDQFHVTQAATAKVFELTAPTKKSIEQFGSYSKYRESLNEQSKKDQEKEDMQYQKLQLELTAMQRQFSDYDDVQNRAKWGFRTAIVSIGLSLVALLLQWMGKK